MINIVDKDKCCGCSACVAKCPQNCITMVEDQEGFLYPRVDVSKCIGCSLCVKTCPIINPYPEHACDQTAVVVQHKNEQILSESTSGGAFSAIAIQTLQHGGIVFGAKLDDDLVVRHTWIDKESDLSYFRNSKYVQSYISPEIYRTLKEFLTAGKEVLFSGTPCQTEGVMHYLGKEYDNLIIVDILCHSVPSPMIFQKYLEYLHSIHFDDIKTVRFRDKHYGYKYSTMNIVGSDGKGGYHRGSESDPWLRAFLSGIDSRPSCYNCCFKKRYRVSDLTLWDCHNPDSFSDQFDPDGGTTNILIHTDKGRKLIEEASSSALCEYVPVEKILTSDAGSLQHCIRMNDRRNDFFRDASVLNGKELFEKYFPITFTIKLKHLVRATACKVGIYTAMKRTIKKILK